MNTLMYENFFTKKHLNFLKNELNFGIIDAISKTLECKDVGN
jgi:phosphopantothenoylcysteine synthetase/decarboxylase